ncbi:rhamnogalacturonan acetylesterase [Streptomyces sp. NPDC006530]|uniref:rhamnogalacturonan acetylesterase n=1 Tax=Streptomyces sp. NPDC006530 TaxID=3364750 RepID=UPI00368BA37F
MTAPGPGRRGALAAAGALVLTAATGRAAHAAPTTPRRMPTLHIAGDSTAAQKYADAAPETGWGMALPFFLRREIAVVNHAMNGRSSKSFIDEGRLAAILTVIRPGDLLLVQFGHNDEKKDDPTRYTEPWSSYQDRLREYVEGARAHGARPVLLTSVERRKFDAGGRALPTHGDYPAAMRALAHRMAAPLLDVQALSLALWGRLGVEETKKYFNWTATQQDNTHFNPPGAIAVARLVARGLRDAHLLTPHDLRRLDETVPASWITWPPAPRPVTFR